MLSAHATEVLKNQSIDQSIINQLIKQQTNNPLLKNRPDSEEKGLLMEPQVWEGSAPFCEILSMPQGLLEELYTINSGLQRVWGLQQEYWRSGFPGWASFLFGGGGGNVFLSPSHVLFAQFIWGRVLHL